MKKNEQTRKGGCVCVWGGQREWPVGTAGGPGGNVAHADEGVPRNAGTCTQETPTPTPAPCTQVLGEGRPGQFVNLYILQ